MASKTSDSAGGPTDIGERFVLGLPMRGTTRVDRVLRNGGSPFNNGKDHDFAPTEGTVRLSYNNAWVLYSYEHWPIAVRAQYQDTSVVVVTADSGPSRFTNQQQWALRQACRKHNTRIVDLPFSLLRARGIKGDTLGRLRLLEVTHEHIVRVPSRRTYGGWCAACFTSNCGHFPPTGFREETFPGEVLFEINEARYISGLDRNDQPRDGNYYLAQLPPPLDADTLSFEGAYAAVFFRPEKGVLRQGKWLFIPAPEVWPEKTDPIYGVDRTKWLLRTTQAKLADEEDTLDNLDRTLRYGMPITSAQACMVLPDIPVCLRHVDCTRHVATRMWLPRRGDDVYVRGRVVDARHRTLRLGDGKVWYRIVESTDLYWSTDKDNEVRFKPREKRRR